MAEVTPITLLIGLPGAGKTTLLDHLLRRPSVAGVAVVALPRDPPVWWRGGCSCCAPRDDVARALRAMLPRVRRDEVRRVVIESSGLVDAGPVLATLLSDTVAASAYRLDDIVTVVDTVNGAAALDTLEQAVRQIAVADRIVLSKSDLADATALRTRLRRINPGALIVTTGNGMIEPAVVSTAAAVKGRGQAGAVAATAGEAGGLFDLAAGSMDVRAWLDAEAFAAAPHLAPHMAPSPGPDTHIGSTYLCFDRPLPWRAVAAWLERLILTHGDAVLRMKGVLNLQAADRPTIIHSVGHLLHPPVALAVWPDGDARQSRLAFITRDLPRAEIEAGIMAFAGRRGHETAAL